MKKFLTIAGSDPCGGAGVQADMRVAVTQGLYPMSVITALTAQTSQGVRNVLLTSPGFVAEQLDAVFSCCIPDVVKIGMLGNGKIVETVVNKLLEYKVKNIVLDTVFTSSSGYELLDNEGILLLKEKLLQICRVITPNIPETEILTGMQVNDTADMKKCAKKFARFFDGDVVITGGHLRVRCDDLLYKDNKFIWFRGERIQGKNTHGTGCAFSSCLACGLAEGKSLEESVKMAKEYVLKHIKTSAAEPLPVF
ncbi:MAG: bifunctional hydroxymethylpyrimidine kinase/phosphomethylpyrimidine kinase [Eubacterium sp.]|nr:bifunctional hydroxymethylpyrimidine kinase/phosphomethylpyrimidine kinase [Eubacterium sp.]